MDSLNIKSTKSSQLPQQKPLVAKEKVEEAPNKMLKRNGTLREEAKEGHLQTFSSSVVVIKPDNFSMNVEATADNKFMNEVNMEEDELIVKVRI